MESKAACKCIEQARAVVSHKKQGKSFHWSSVPLIQHRVKWLSNLGPDIFACITVYKTNQAKSKGPLC